MKQEIEGISAKILSKALQELEINELIRREVQDTGFTEALAEEMKPFGIHTKLVYLGYFRTDFLSKNSA